MLENIVKGLI